LALEEDEVTAAPDPGAGEETVDGPVGWTLLVGLLVSVSVMVIGLAVVAANGGTSAAHVLPLDREVPDLLKGSAAAPLDLGILLLFATPLAGVLVALAGFIRVRDTTFTVITLVLLAILAVGFAVALH
jgi:uncharacterized membrane protein